MEKGINNILYYGDNLNILREHIQDNSVDLIYLDPPFQSGQDYNLLYEERNGTKSRAQMKVFTDTWQWGQEAENTYDEITKRCPAKLVELIQGLRKFLSNTDMMAYLVMMAIRLVELHRVLKDTGSIYLHCDPRANHYLKLILDAIWGVRHFQNEIIWCYRQGGRSQKNFSKKHDIIFYYTKGEKWTFNADDIRIPYNGTGGYQTSGKGVTSKITGKTYKPNPLGKIPEDWWDIPALPPMDKERLGYPTQKPEALLERIIKVSSNKGDIVLDPFCGCGTTVAVAQQLKRKWIGIDITHLATYLIKRRLRDMFGEDVKYKVIGEPVDYSGAKALAEQDKYQFEWWVRSLIGAIHSGEEKKKGADKGIDGYIFFRDDPKSTGVKRIIIQVKGGHITSAQIRDLRGVIDREKAQIGAFITLEKPTKQMRTEAASAGFYEHPLGKHLGKYPKLQILTIAELLAGKKISYPPWMKNVTLKEAPRFVQKPKQLEIGGETK